MAVRAARPAEVSGRAPRIDKICYMRFAPVHFAVQALRTCVLELKLDDIGCGRDTILARLPRLANGRGDDRAHKPADRSPPPQAAKKILDWISGTQTEIRWLGF